MNMINVYSGWLKLTLMPKYVYISCMIKLNYHSLAPSGLSYVIMTSSWRTVVFGRVNFTTRLGDSQCKPTQMLNMFCSAVVLPGSTESCINNSILDCEESSYHGRNYRCISRFGEFRNINWVCVTWSAIQDRWEKCLVLKHVAKSYLCFHDNKKEKSTCLLYRNRWTRIDFVTLFIV